MIVVYSCGVSEHVWSEGKGPTFIQHGLLLNLCSRPFSLLYFEEKFYFENMSSYHVISKVEHSVTVIFSETPEV